MSNAGSLIVKTKHMENQFQTNMNIVRKELIAQRTVEIPNLADEISQALKEEKNQTKPEVKTDDAPKKSTWGNWVFGETYKSKDGIVFKYWNPATLTQKQKNVIYRFMERVSGELAGVGVSFSEYAPFIDLIFKLQRHEITNAQWTRITKIELNLSTWDRMHDHNM